jgi:hypothetical protein
LSIWNFAFGSHLNKQQLSRIIGKEPERSLRAKLPDYRLTFWKVVDFPKEFAYLAGGGSPAFIPKKGDCVYGVLYFITEQQRRLLDEYEAKWDYEPIQLQVDAESVGKLRAYAHNRKKRMDFAPPSSEFLKLMLDGLRAYGYSDNIVHCVQSVAQREDR